MTPGTNRGVQEALRALSKKKGPPTEEDRPPLSAFSGPKRKQLPGQFDLFGREVPGIAPRGSDDDELDGRGR